MSRLGLDLDDANSENTGGDSDTKPANGSGGSQRLDQFVHPVAGARVPLSGCQLQTPHMPEDEAIRVAHKVLQATTGLQGLQTIVDALLAARKDLQGDKVSGAFMSEHEAAVGAATFGCPVQEQPVAAS